jgi:hypothetical protein
VADFASEQAADIVGIHNGEPEQDLIAAIEFCGAPGIHAGVWTPLFMRGHASSAGWPGVLMVGGGRCEPLMPGLAAARLGQAVSQRHEAHMGERETGLTSLVCRAGGVAMQRRLPDLCALAREPSGLLWSPTALAGHGPR